MTHEPAPSLPSVPPRSLGQERRLHPLTPVRDAWKPFAVLAAIGSQNLEGVRSAISDATAVGISLGAVLCLCVGVAYGYLSWRFTWFAVSESELMVRTGLLMRRTSHVRLDRLQAVDITTPLLGRLVGLTSLSLDVAGADKRDRLAYLSQEDAHLLRRELLARAGQESPGSMPEAPGNAEVLATVTPRMLALSIVLRGGLWSLLGFAAALVGLIIVTGELVLLALAIPAVLAAGQLGVGRFIAEFGWMVIDGPDGLRLDHGLLDLVHETVPLNRMQSVQVIEPLLWRRRGWARVELHVASSANTVLVPVATREVALRVAGRVLPGKVLPDPGLFNGPPSRAAHRLPLWWRGHGVAVTEHLLATRKGLLQRQLSLVPHAKVQSIRFRQGPWLRRLALADVHVDVAGGTSTTARLRDVTEAHELVQDQADRSRTARRASVRR